MTKLNPSAIVMTPIFAFGMAVMVSAPTLSAEMQSHEKFAPQPLIIAAGEQQQPEAVEGAFKRQDPDSIIRNTADPDENAPTPDPDVEPTGFKSKDADSIIRETADPDENAPTPDPDVKPEGFKSKDQTGLENLKR